MAIKTFGIDNSFLSQMGYLCVNQAPHYLHQTAIQTLETIVFDLVEASKYQNESGSQSTCQGSSFWFAWIRWRNMIACRS